MDATGTPLLRDADTWQALQRDGFAVLDAGPEVDTERMRQHIEAGLTLPPDRFYYSLLANTPAQNQALRTGLKNELQNFYARHFRGYRTLTESFLSKPAHTESELLLHQDWCYTDESRHPAYNLWIPLEDVTESNGAMFVLPGSHTRFRNLRSGSLPTARISMQALPAEQIRSVPLKRGQVLIFHPAVFHGSYPNRSARHRVVVTATVLPETAPFLYYHANGSPGEVSVYKLEDDAYLDGLEKLATGNAPDAPVQARLPYTHRVPTAEELLAAAVRYDQ